MIKIVEGDKKKEELWRYFFLIVCFIGVGVLLVGLHHQTQEKQCVPNGSIGCNPDCTGYIVNGTRYCNQNSYAEYLQTLRFIENERQLRALGE